MLNRIGTLVELSRPCFAPQRHLCQPLIESLEYAPPRSQVAGEQICRDRHRLRTQTIGQRYERVVEVEGLGSKDLQRPHIDGVSDENSNVPPGHHPVEHPPAGMGHHVEHAQGNDIEPISDVQFVVAKSRVLDSAYCLNTSASPH
jgi:hypothetical protein